MTNKIIILLSIFLTSCQCKPVTFHKEGDFAVYVRLEVKDKKKTSPPHFIPMLKSHSVSHWFCFSERNTVYRLSVLSEDGNLLTETEFCPKNVKNIVLSPNTIRTK